MKPTTNQKPQKNETDPNARRYVLHNRRARHEYAILETFDAGLVLVGTEVKSIRNGRANLQDAFARIQNGEVWLYGMHILPYEHGNRHNVEPVRPRKLLLHRHEIERMRAIVEQKGPTIIPLSLYFQRGFAKVELGIGKGKKLYDKREDIAKRDVERDRQRELSER
jgi:SsrA-binding protein